MVEICRSAHEGSSEATAINSSGLASCAKSLYDGLPALGPTGLNATEKYVDDVFGTPSFGEFHNVSSAHSNVDTITLRGANAALLARGNCPEAGGPSEPDWPTTFPGKLMPIPGAGDEPTSNSDDLRG